ncbi:PTS system cellobiose-specific IIA component [Scopulibacillus darangshiensis]|uniref:PTS system cellobiose-specific IIA component n=1 Tax=Scopulibacillus darangshiensis TaxID=442528 RepID=A0A4R2P8E2_9BACL|nr:PTS lactose/cellobiose transporter subunit IIA [Scopulibacillus darangshiensis]TCP31213.1 PTS system cellobiose-specific IIA component [Scopulibacillus darangshiensis]
MNDNSLRKNDFNEISMKIILNAGDARLIIKEGLDCVAACEFEAAKEKLTEAKKKITAAHAAQTETIQGEARGEKIDFSLLFAHAQDTLMTIMSEWNTANHLVRLFETFDGRLRKLEEK